MGTTTRWAAILCPAILAVVACSDSSAVKIDGQATLAAWVQYTAGGIEARAVVTGECPQIDMDGQSVQMTVRAGMTSDHPNLVCVAPLSGEEQAITLGGVPLPVPVQSPRRLVVMGDTGCRLSDSHGLYQECDNDSIWPFTYVARSVAAYEPDIILYTGDYIYREAACPEGNQGCVDSPFGDNQATWIADWFDPAQSVHRAAPLVLVRGNHETCARAGSGWFRYLDARDRPDNCIDNTQPWALQMGDISLGVLDTARVSDDDEPLTGLFAAQIEELKALLDGDAWIATHRPFWGFGADDDTGELVTPTEALQDAVREVGLPDDTRLIVAAHIHLAEVIGFEGDRPPQLVVANGGTQLVPRVTPPGEIDGLEIAQEKVLYQYGFVTMEPGTGESSWEVSFRDIEGRVLERCLLRDLVVECD